MGKGNTLAGKKTPTRQCIGCGDKKDKKELIRVIKTPEGEKEKWQGCIYM